MRQAVFPFVVEQSQTVEFKAVPSVIGSGYETFRELLFAGYRCAIDRLADNRFFVIMTGDSRDKNGGYYCSESETELFLKGEGLLVYNKIVYLESEFTRLAHAKKTLHHRKFPKREQKIIVGYKGGVKAIKEEFPAIGVDASLRDNLGIGACFTAISLARSYLIRRWFNRRTNTPPRER